VTGATTNRIPFEEAADLLTAARACVAVVIDGVPRLEPAVVTYEDPLFLVGVARGSIDASDVDEAVLVLDEGVRFFDLRAIYVRGAPSPTDERGDDRVWFAIDPTKVSCWDYGRLRLRDAAD
jgi:hypothetical protein